MVSALVEYIWNRYAQDIWKVEPYFSLNIIFYAAHCSLFKSSKDTLFASVNKWLSDYIKQKT